MSANPFVKSFDVELARILNESHLDNVSIAQLHDLDGGDRTMHTPLYMRPIGVLMPSGRAHAGIQFNISPRIDRVLFAAFAAQFLAVLALIYINEYWFSKRRHMRWWALGRSMFPGSNSDAPTDKLVSTSQVLAISAICFGTLMLSSFYASKMFERMMRRDMPRELITWEEFVDTVDSDGLTVVMNEESKNWLPHILNGALAKLEEDILYSNSTSGILDDVSSGTHVYIDTMPNVFQLMANVGAPLCEHLSIHEFSDLPMLRMHLTMEGEEEDKGRRSRFLSTLWVSHIDELQQTINHEVVEQQCRKNFFILDHEPYHYHHLTRNTYSGLFALYLMANGVAFVAMLMEFGLGLRCGKVTPEVGESKVNPFHRTVIIHCVLHFDKKEHYVKSVKAKLSLEQAIEESQHYYKHN